MTDKGTAIKIARMSDRDTFISFKCSPTAIKLVCMASLDHAILSDTIKFHTSTQQDSDLITIRFNSNPKYFWGHANRSHVLDHTQLLLYFYVIMKDKAMVKIGAGRWSLSTMIEQKGLPTEPIQLYDPFGLILGMGMDGRSRDVLHITDLFHPNVSYNRLTVTCLDDNIVNRLCSKQPPGLLVHDRIASPTIYGRTNRISSEEAAFDDAVDRFINEHANRVEEDNGYTWYYSRGTFNTTNMELSFLLSRTIESNEGFWLCLMNRTLFIEGGVMDVDFFAKMITYYVSSFIMYKNDPMGDEYMEAWFPRTGDCEDFAICIIQMYRSFVACRNIQDTRLLEIRKNALKYIPFVALNRAQIGSSGNRSEDYCSHVNVYYIPKAKFHKMLAYEECEVPIEVKAHLEKYNSKEDESLSILLGEATSPFDTSFHEQSNLLDRARNELHGLFEQSRAMRSFKRGVTKRPFDCVFLLFTTYFMESIPKCNLFAFMLSSRDGKKSYGVKFGSLSDIHAETKTKALAMPIPSEQLINRSRKQALLRPQPPVFRYDRKRQAYEPMYASEEDVGNLETVLQTKMSQLFGQYEGLLGQVPQNSMNLSSHVLFIPQSELVNKEKMEALAKKLYQMNATVDLRVFRLSSSSVCCDMRVQYPSYGWW
jgi:hypothetical protein